MKRRVFLIQSITAGVALGISGIGCGPQQPAYAEWLDKPEVLSQICDLKTLKEIGNAYRSMSKETEQQKLTDLILTDSAGHIVSANTDKAVMQSLIQMKIENDFETGQTVIVKGWVLSQTEARQCALLSRNNN